MMVKTVLQARLVFPVDAPPIENGFVEMVDGRITAVSHLPMSGATNLGNMAILPSLVNAHTHLEFGDLDEPLGPAEPFTDWLKRVIASRRAAPAGEGDLSIRRGRAECGATGTGLIGDIVSAGWSPEWIRGDGAYVVAFQESLGLRAERVAPEVARARQYLEQGASVSAFLRRGLSPHAPYSVHPELVRQLVSLAREFQAPVAMHLAETRAELQLLEHGTGEFVDFLQTLGVWDPTAIPKGSGILDYLQILSEAERALIIHGNYLNQTDIAFLSTRPGLTVVYCPRTHAYFGHSPHPWRELLSGGAKVAFGTDSRASNPDLSLWEELQFLRRGFPEVNPAVLLNMATLGGARALGRELDLGSLTPGKAAGLSLANLPESDTSDPHELLFRATKLRRLCNATAFGNLP